MKGSLFVEIPIVDISVLHSAVAITAKSNPNGYPEATS